MPFKDKEKKREYQKEYRKKMGMEYLIKHREHVKKYREKNPEEVKVKSIIHNKKYREKNKEKFKELYIKNKEKYKEKGKIWRENNKDKRKKYNKNYPKEKKNEQNRNYISQRRKIDPLFRFTSSIRSLISRSIKRKGFKKTSKTQIILGTDYKSFKEYLEGQWEPWMSWDNYGKYKIGTFNYGWDIDHIIPTSIAKTEEELLKLNHYINLKPLCSKVNRDIKRDNV